MTLILQTLRALVLTLAIPTLAIAHAVVPAHAAESSEMAIAESVCLNNLYEVEASRRLLKEQGWSEVALPAATEPYRHPLVGEFFHGVVPSKSVAFLSKDSTSLVVLGRAHNDETPHMKCSLITSKADIGLQGLIAATNRLFAPVAVSEQSMPDSGAVFRQWALETFDKNISKARPYNSVNLDTFARPTAERKLRLIYSVVGILPSP